MSVIEEIARCNGITLRPTSYVARVVLAEIARETAGLLQEVRRMKAATGGA